MRDFAIEYAKHFIGVPYEWGGDNPQGLDCSGFVGLVLRGVGVMDNKEDLTAQGIYDKFKQKEVSSPYAGCLVFYGRSINRISHIGFMVNADIVLEAGGGNSKTTSEEVADEMNAFVRARPYDYRDPVAYIDPF